MRKYDIGSHMADDVLERYAMRSLGADDVAAVEEHLFACDACRTQLDQTEDFIAATKGALRSSKRKPPARAAEVRGWGVLNSWFTLPLLAAAVAALVIGLVMPERARYFPSSEAAVRLYAMRGPESAIARAHGRATLVLNLEAEELSAQDEYIVQVVNAAGGQVWTGKAQRLGPDLRVTIHKLTRSGRYWARVFKGDELVREYGLQIE